MQRPAVAADISAARATRTRSSARPELVGTTTRPAASGPSASRGGTGDRCRRVASDGPEVRQDAPRSANSRERAGERANASAGHRRNGFPALTWIDDELLTG